jgi:hypothetical protein
VAVIGTQLNDGVVLDGLRRLAVLPGWLTAGTDPARVTAALHASVPELTSGDWWVVTCEPKLRLKEGTCWTASYRLTLAGRTGESRQLDLGGEYRPVRRASSEPDVVRGELGDPSWEARLPRLGLILHTRVQDDALPALPQLTDPRLARQMLEEHLRAHQPGIHIESCTPEVMRYKPGSRCTVRYRVRYDAIGASGPHMVVAKTYRGDKGENAYRGMVALDRAGIPTATVTLAEPLAFLSDLNVLLQGPVDEQETLKALTRRACTDGAAELLAMWRTDVAKTADGLAALHTCGVEHGEVVTWTDELLEVRELIERLSVPLPETAGAAEPYLDALEALAEEHGADSPGPAHRSFRPAQVLLAGGHIAFIDFDGLCTAEPAIDVALFRAAVRDVGASTAFEGNGTAIENRLRLLDKVCDDFLARYRAAHPISIERVALWESLDLLTFVLHCWSKLQPRRLAHRMAMLEHHLRTTPLLR